MMIRYLTVAWLLFVIAPLQVVLAEIDVVVVTPESLKANLAVVRVKTVHDDKAGLFEVRLRLDKPQHVTTRLVIASGDTEQEIFATASVVTESETTVKFSVPMKSISHATFQLGVGGYDLKDGVAKPWLGGTMYVIKLQDFTVGTAPEAERGGPPREADGLVTGSMLPGGGESLRKGTDYPGDPYPTQASAQGDELIRKEIKTKGLVEIHSQEDNIDTSRVVVFLGRHNKVEVRPGTSVFVELPRPTKEFYWQAGDAPEGVGDSELPTTFTHVWCRWSSDGNMTWRCFGPEEKMPPAGRGTNPSVGPGTDPFAGPGTDPAAGPGTDPFAGPGATRATQVEGELGKWQGTWNVIYAERNGTLRPTKDRSGLTGIRVAGNRLTLITRHPDSDEKEATSDGTLEVNSAGKQPAEFSFNVLIPAFGIYECGDNTLRICFREAGSDGSERRPTEFKTAPDSGRVLYVLNRVRADNNGVERGNVGAAPGANSRVRAFVRVHKAAKADDIVKLATSLSRAGIASVEFGESDAPDGVLELLCPEDYPKNSRDRLGRQLRTVLDGMPGEWTVHAVSALTPKLP